MRVPVKSLFVCLVFLMSGLLAIHPARAEIITEDVIYDHNGVVLKGYVAYDDSAGGTRPGVMVVHQWMGLGDYEKMRARRLAKLGYVAFAADVYGADTRPNTTHEASLASSTFRENRNLYRRRLKVSLMRMKTLDRVDENRLAAIGYCFGGTGVLELARSGAQLDAVLSFHGGLTNPRPEDARNIRATVQVHHGAEDSNVTQQHVLSFWTEMKKYASVEWDLNVYSNAPHGFTEPGTEAYNERADHLSWKAMKQLFEAQFSGKGK